MPRRYSPEVRRQVVELARAGTKVSQLATTFGMADATIYNWLVNGVCCSGGHAYDDVAGVGEDCHVDHGDDCDTG